MEYAFQLCLNAESEQAVSEHREIKRKYWNKWNIFQKIYFSLIQERESIDFDKGFLGVAIRRP